MSTATVNAGASSFYTMDGTMRMNGTEFASGLDTQNIIKALTANISSKIDKEKQMEQKDIWRRDAFRSVEDMLQKFQDTYFSYSTNSSTNIMSRSFFDTEALVSSNTSVVTATGDQSDAGNVVINSISNLASAATYTGGQVSNEVIQSTGAMGNIIASSSYLNIAANGQTYTLQLGANINTTGKNDADVASALKDQLNTSVKKINDAIKQSTGTEGTIAFSTDGNGSISLYGATVTGASTNFGMGLGHLSGGAYDMSSMKVQSGSVANLTSLSNQLAGSELTVQLNGVTKTITFDQSDSSQYSNAADIATYLQRKLDSAYGSGKVSVASLKANPSDAQDDELSIKTVDGTDPTNVFTLASSSCNGVLDTDGLLRIRSGESNRLELDKTLDELVSTSELRTGLTSGSVTNPSGTYDYEFTINGKTFDFKKDTELNTVINTINDDPTANVTVSYSQTLNKFRIVSDDTGAQGQITFSDSAGGGNLTSVLFSGGTMTAGQDLSMNVNLGGTTQTITRSTNSFTLDGITMNINGTLSSTDPKIKFSASGNVDDLYKKISDFVDQYNAIIAKVNTDVTQMPPSAGSTNGGGQTYDPLTDDQAKTMTDAQINDWNTKAQQGLLFCDPQLGTLQSDIRTAMESPVSSVGMSLADIGISTADGDYTSGGKLVLDVNKLKNALKSDPDKVEQLFTNSDGLASRVKAVLKKNIGEFGNDGALYNVAGSNTMIGVDNSQYGNEIRDYDTQIKDLKTQLKDKQDSLQAKFTNMEAIISKLSSQSSYIASMSGSGS